MPELLTVFFSSVQGLFSTGIYNILSSNIINLIQYLASIKINKNERELKNKTIKVQLVIVLITILIPIIMIYTNVREGIGLVPVFIIAFVLFYKIRNNAYKVYNTSYMSKTEKNKIEEEKRWVKHKKKIAIEIIIKLILTGVALFLIR